MTAIRTSDFIPAETNDNILLISWGGLHTPTSPKNSAMVEPWKL